MKKKLLVLAGALLVIGAIAGGAYLYRVMRYQQIVKAIELSEVDLAKVADGTYEGDFDALMVGAKVSVAIQDQKITEILLLEHKTDRGASAEPIIDEVVAQQSLAVEVVSGATNSSKVILKSIEEALAKGLKE